MFDFIKKILHKQMVPVTGPNTLQQLLQQFDAPAKCKTQADIIRDYQVKETMAALELDMLRMDPTVFFTGRHVERDEQNLVHRHAVPCACRPEVVYCCHGKS